jgi:hypothetical protein
MPKKYLVCRISQDQFRCSQSRGIGAVRVGNFVSRRLLPFVPALIALTISGAAMATPEEDTAETLYSIFVLLMWTGLFVAWALGFHKGGQR